MSDLVNFDGNVAKKVRDRMDTLIVDALGEEALDNMILAAFKRLCNSTQTTKYNQQRGTTEYIDVPSQLDQIIENALQIKIKEGVDQALKMDRDDTNFSNKIINSTIQAMVTKTLDDPKVVRNMLESLATEIITAANLKWMQNAGNQLLPRY